MTKISYKRHRFPPEIIQHAVWLYFRFTLSFRDVEDLLTERGLETSEKPKEFLAMQGSFLKVVLAFSLAYVVLSCPALAQNPEVPTSAQAVAIQKKIDDFASKLSIEETNALLRTRIHNLLIEVNVETKALQDNKLGFVDSFQSGWLAYKKYIWRNIIGFPEMIKGSIQAISAVFHGRTLIGSIQFLALVVVVLAIGFTVELLVTKITRNWRDRVTKMQEKDSIATLTTLGQRLALELAGLTAFAIAASVAAQFLFTDLLDEHLTLNFVMLTILMVRLMSILMRFILDPDKSSLRLVSADDWTARFIYTKLVILTGIVGVGLYALTLMNKFETPGVGPFRFWVGLYVYGSVIYLTWRARKGLTSIIKGQDEHLTPGLERMAAWWPKVTIIVIIGQYMLTQYALSTGVFYISTGKGILTLTIIVLLPFMDTMVRGIIKYLSPPMVGEGPVAELAYYQTLHSYVRIGRILLISFLILFIGFIWGINFRILVASGIGAQSAANLLGSIMVLAVGYLMWEAVNLLINRQLAKDMSTTEDEDHSEDESGGAGKSRLATVLPLIQITLQVAIITITVLLALSRLGVNITPLLAGAGVLGLAVGFGAQTLVKDIVSGVFFLLDDAFRVGEYIDIDGTVGTVEKISLRSLQLRHHNGPVHIVPYGEIPKLTNHSRDYVIMKLRFTVPFNTDIEKVRKLFKKIGKEMMENSDLAKNFIEPFKSQGVVDVNDVGIVLRGKFKTKPGAQWVIRKEVYTRVQKAFEENDIDFARKEVRVHIPDMADNSKLDKKQNEIIRVAAASVAGGEETPDKSKNNDGSNQG